jgi:glucokinase
MREAVLGIDVGGTFTKFGVIDKEGNCLAENFTSTDAFDDINTYLENLYGLIEELITGIKEEVKILGIGVGAPNGNYYKGTIEHAANLKWRGVIPFANMIKSHYNLPVVLTNDANAAAIGEMIYGGAKGMKNFVVITLGTGLGSGIVVNGELVYGHTGFAGEVGHVCIIPDGRLHVNTGLRGSLESYVSASGLKRTVLELMADLNYDTELRNIVYNDLTAEKIFDLARKGDKIALEAFEYTGKILGQALANTVMHTSPEAIFLFGGLAKAGGLIFAPTIKHMEANLLPVFRNTVKILPSVIDETSASILGASAIIWKELNK